MNDNRFTTWVKTHKIELVVAGGVIVLTTVGVLLLAKNTEGFKRSVRNNLRATNLPAYNVDVDTDTTRVSVPVIDPEVKVVSVKEHFRKLAEGYHPSPEKRFESSKRGIELMDDQTIVNAHTREYAA